jgi:catechol 2,3-dioxygenase-like lactoylglutathione lyase family enzyme
LARLKRIVLPVADLARAELFYGRLLGLNEAKLAVRPSEERTYIIGGMQLVLLLNENAGPSRRHIGISVDDLGALYLLAKRHGILCPVSGISAVWEYPDGQIHLFLNDPFGNIIEAVGGSSKNSDRNIFLDDLQIASSASFPRLYGPSHL